MTGLNDIHDIPLAWRELLAAVQAVCPTAVLAGGALRDRDNGRKVKDLDLFINAPDQRTSGRAIADLRAAGFAVVEEFNELTVYPEDQNLEVVQVADLEWPSWPQELGGRLPLQLIFTPWDTARIVERFDYGICRIAFDGQQIVRPPEYTEDQQAKVFRLRRDRPTPVSMRGSIHRYARLVQKYEGWTWWPYEQPEDFVFGTVAG